MNNQITSAAIASMIRDIYQDQNQTNDSLNQAIIDNVYAVTMKFESVFLQCSKENPESYLKHNREWYHWLMRSTIGNNLGRKKHLQPLCWSFVDFPGSKGAMTEKRVGECLKSGLLHIHSVIALKLGDGQILRRPLLVAGSAHQLRRFGEVKVERYDPKRGSLERMIEYCKKGSDLIGSRHCSDCYDLLPH